MKIESSCLTVLVTLTILLAPQPARAQSTEGDLESVSFLVGCWAQPAPEGSGLREFWAPAASNMLTGLSQFWRDGTIVDFEFHRIDASSVGPVLTPHPRGKASVAFSPAEQGPSRIVWQNLEHDFPQRIIYDRVASDSLVVRIEGGEGPAMRSTEWRMARIACPM